MKKTAIFIITSMLALSFFGCDNKSEKVINDEKVTVTVDNKTEETKENKNQDDSTDNWENSFNLVADGERYVVVKNSYESVTLKAKVVGNGDKSADFQWYRCDENGTTLTEYNYGSPLSMGESLTIEGIPEEEANVTRYYKVSAMVENTFKNLIFTVTLVPEQAVPEFIIVSADGIYQYSVYSPDETVTLSARVESDSVKSVDYQWYRCDEYGNTLKEYNGGTPLSMGEKLEITGIPYEEMMIPRYYLVAATVEDTTRTAIFSVTLQPMGVEVEEPTELEDDFVLVSEDGNYEYTVYSPEEEVVLKANLIDTSGILWDLWDEEMQMHLVDYCWTRCDENGNTLESHPTPVSWGQTCTVSIPWEEMMTPRYYRATVMVGDISKHIIFKVLLVPMGVEAEE